MRQGQRKARRGEARSEYLSREEGKQKKAKAAKAKGSEEKQTGEGMADGSQMRHQHESTKSEALSGRMKVEIMRIGNESSTQLNSRVDSRRVRETRERGKTWKSASNAQTKRVACKAQTPRTRGKETKQEPTSKGNEIMESRTPYPPCSFPRFRSRKRQAEGTRVCAEGVRGWVATLLSSAVLLPVIVGVGHVAYGCPPYGMYQEASENFALAGRAQNP